VIRDPAPRPLFGGCAPIDPLLRGILNIAEKAKRGPERSRGPNPISSKLDGPGFVPPGMREFPRRARNRNARHPGASRAVSRVVAGAPDTPAIHQRTDAGSNNQKAWSQVAELPGGAPDLTFTLTFVPPRV
jgi:hypothetical protein